jgi:hypothetical protein
MGEPHAAKSFVRTSFRGLSAVITSVCASKALANWDWSKLPSLPSSFARMLEALLELPDAKVY